ncbi:MAG: NADPH-dependent assimilatory sulfite reductase hemoprotein subunit [Thermoguttaceae bacterium]
MGEAEKLSGVEKIKQASNFLHGSIAEELANSNPAFAEDTANLIKHHGMYQQDDRDLRGVKDATGKRLEKAYSLMIRVKVPGGRLSCDQLLAQLDLCDELGSATARITNRQDVQLHGVLKKNIRQAVQRINDVQCTTLGACGDVERNVLCCPAPFNDSIRDLLQETAQRISSHLLPRTTAYHEIWLRDSESGAEQLCGGGSNGHEIEPIYGKSYLPRKFKIAIALAEDNCIDVYTNDLGFLAISEKGKLLGFNVFVGGGFGVTPSNKRTFPAVAKRMAFIAPAEALDVATAAIKVFRDYGNREDRKRARLKYLIADWGLERFKAKVEEYYGRKLSEPHPDDVRGFDDHIGWYAQGDGRWFYGLNVENGRILDRDGFTLKTALREICRDYRPGICLTAHQSILFTGLASGDRAGVEAILRRNGVKLDDEISNARRWSMACVAMPTCPLAVAESERVLPQLIDKLEVELARLDLAGERFTIRMTGCPNGCSRPYNADVGLVGRTLNKYTIYLGGRLLGDRLNFVYKELVKYEDIIPTLLPVFAYFKFDRHPGETLGDFCHRKGPAELAAWTAEHQVAT